MIAYLRKFKKKKKKLLERKKEKEMVLPFFGNFFFMGNSEGRNDTIAFMGTSR